MKKFFLHGLESSGQGTKGRFLSERFPDVLTPNFEGNLEGRLQQLEELTKNDRDLLFVGSSFGGLMATCFTLSNPSRVHSLVLMAPALNFPGLIIPTNKIETPVYLLIGSLDDVTPPDKVIPVAKKIFSNLEINIVEEDHLLHGSFPHLNWEKLLFAKEQNG